MKRVAVFASGRGSNLSALLAAQALYSSFQIVLVASNVPTSGALSIAGSHGIETFAIASRGMNRREHESALLAEVLRHSIDLICLAGYMRVLGTEFIRDFSSPILNIHPSLLPSFPGLHAQRQAVDAGVRWSGATVHFVDAGLDTGPIVLQEPVAVHPGDTEDRLAARILEAEHVLYPSAVDIVARGAYKVNGRVVTILG